MIDHFLREFDRQTALYEAMLETTDTALLKELLSRVAEIDRDIGGIRRRWNEIAPALDVETAGRAGRSISRARHVLSRLAEAWAPSVPWRRIREAYEFGSVTDAEWRRSCR